MEEWESHEPGYFSIALFDHRKHLHMSCPIKSQMATLDMPICDGIEACKRVRLLEGRKKVTTTIPSMYIVSPLSLYSVNKLPLYLVVALSADCQDSTKQLCLSAGMNAFFSKPLKKSKLFF